MRVQFLFLFGLISLFCFSASASELATIVSLQGRVFVLENPSKTISGLKPPRVKYKNTYYHAKDAKQGDQIENGSVIRVSVGGRARMIYPNGDYFDVGSGTSCEISWKKDNVPSLNLNYGHIRAVLKSGGPRKGTKVRTKAATMGVRGTDFAVSVNSKNETKIVALRGKVAVKPAQKEAKPLDVVPGVTANIKDSTSDEAVELRTTTKTEISKIQAQSQISKPVESATADASALDLLNRYAKEMVIEDIKKDDPNRFAAVENANSLEDLDAKALDSAIDVAPEKAKLIKPDTKHLEKFLEEE